MKILQDTIHWYIKMKTRQPIAEIELFDLIKNSGIEFNKDQRKWFSVDNIPI
ncbi:MAG: hypothetical protein CM15mP129_06460 [Chloroflexota bacterium]|nr:MAG: hypothetical protein CM15mP129_06460 [Chloroflexota bacterium]